MDENKIIENEEIVVEEEKVEEKKPSLEEQLQQLLVENAKLKRASDRNASEAAEYKKKYRSTLSEKEQIDAEKAEKEAEREEQIQQIMRENAIYKLKGRYISLGYDEDRAEKAAVAQHENDTETLFRLQKEVQQEQLKTAEARWLKSRPDIKSNSGNSEELDPFLKGFLGK